MKGYMSEISLLTSGSTGESYGVICVFITWSSQVLWSYFILCDENSNNAIVTWATRCIVGPSSTLSAHAVIEPTLSLAGWRLLLLGGQFRGPPSTRFHVITSAERRRLYAFISVSLLTTSRKNAWTDFHEIHEARWDLVQKQSETFGDVPFNPWNTGFFPGQPVSVNNIVETRMNGFQWNFQDKSDSRQETILNILGMLDPGSFFFVFWIRVC